MSYFSRRQILKGTGALLGVSAIGLPLMGVANSVEKFKVLVTGAHPDDPETGCGGLIANFAKAGHEVVIAYLTTGEAGIEGKTNQEAANIRAKEAVNACGILNAKPVFIGQIDGDTQVHKEDYSGMQQLLEKKRLDVLLTHWPLDTHKDHRACSALTYAAWLTIFPKPDLYFYEVMSGGQTQNFYPTNFVDLTNVRAQKHMACFAHSSQEIEKDYELVHGRMEIFRGMESGYDYAEAFVRHWYNPKNIVAY